MIELSVFYEGNKTATVYKVQNPLQYMVLCYDEDEDFTRTEFFYTEQDAENFAEDWINE